MVGPLRRAQQSIAVRPSFLRKCIVWVHVFVYPHAKFTNARYKCEMLGMQSHARNGNMRKAEWGGEERQNKGEVEVGLLWRPWRKPVQNDRGPRSGGAWARAAEQGRLDHWGAQCGRGKVGGVCGHPSPACCQVRVKWPLAHGCLNQLSSRVARKIPWGRGKCGIQHATEPGRWGRVGWPCPVSPELVPPPPLQWISVGGVSVPP